MNVIRRIRSGRSGDGLKTDVLGKSFVRVRGRVRKVERETELLLRRVSYEGAKRRSASLFEFEIELSACYSRMKVSGCPNPVAQMITSASRVRPSLKTTLRPSAEIPSGSASLTTLIFPAETREWNPFSYDMARPPRTLGPLKRRRNSDDQRSRSTRGVL